MYFIIKNILVISERDPVFTFKLHLICRLREAHGNGSASASDASESSTFRQTDDSGSAGRWFHAVGRGARGRRSNNVAQPPAIGH